MIYKIYGKDQKGSWEFIDTETELEKAKSMGENIDNTEYEKYMIIEFDKRTNTDTIICCTKLVNRKEQFKTKYKVQLEGKDNRKRKKRNKRYIENYFEKEIKER